MCKCLFGQCASGTTVMCKCKNVRVLVWSMWGDLVLQHRNVEWSGFYNTEMCEC